jgi:hypothetical protein
MTAEPAATLVVEYSCDRRCQVEVDVTDRHTRYTKHQMLSDALSAHQAAHRSDDRVYTGRPGAVVRAGAL